MSESRPTPGPWTVHNMAIYGPFAPTGREKSGVVVAFVKQINRPRHEADARLIAAAPDLLEACKALASWLSSFSMPPTSTIEEKQAHLAFLESVIQKAEGDPMTDAAALKQHEREIAGRKIQVKQLRQSLGLLISWLPQSANSPIRVDEASRLLNILNGCED